MKSLTQKQFSGNMYALLSGVCVTGYFILNRYSYTHFHPHVEDYVSTFMLIGGLIALLSQIARNPRARQNHPKSFSKIIFMSLIASVGIGLTVVAQKYTVASNAAIIATLSVPVTIFTSHIILGQSISRYKLIWIVGLLAGIYLAIIGFNAYELKSGDVIMVLSCLLLGLSNTLSKPLVTSTSPANLRDYRFMTGGLLFGAVILLFPNVQLVTNAGLYPVFAALFFWSAIFCYYKAVEQISPSHAIVINNIHPALTSVIGVAVLSETLSLAKVLGITIAIFSIYQISLDS